MLRGTWRVPVVAMLALSSAGCVGKIGGDGDEAGSANGGPNGTGPTAEVLSEIGLSGLRRLTAIEYRTTVLDLMGVDAANATQYLPEDLRRPFDNDYTIQTASQALIDGAELLSAGLAADALADPALRAKIVPCEPSGANDEACFRQFIETFGRRALRHTLAPEQVDGFMVLFDHAAQSGDFWVAVDSGLRAFLQHTEFLYRVEIGELAPNDPAVFRLSDTELATRLSYFLWGTMPSDWLLDAAEDGSLSTAEGVRAAVATMLEDDHAKARISRFHSMWLSYETLAHAPEISDAMMLETDALLERVIFEEKRPWTEMLRSEETYLTPELATHYGLPAPAGGKPGWVPYGDSGRRGVLSQGTFLSAVPKFDDTSPTQRGLLIRTRLFCQTINKPPPELKVNVDMPPEGPDPNACKSVRYNMSTTDGCKNCHALMDPVGFGLENYDTAGRYREFETDRPDCPIDGTGTLEGVGSFKGPAELADLMIKAGGVDACVAKQVYRFAMGRFALDEYDEALLTRLVEVSTASTELHFDQLLVELTGSDAFRYRREEAAQ